MVRSAASSRRRSVAWGREVTIIQDEAKFLPREERDAAQILAQSMARDGVTILLNTRVVAARARRGATSLETENYKTRHQIEAERVLVSVGRVPNVVGLDLERAGVASSPAEPLRWMSSCAPPTRMYTRPETSA